MEQVEIKLHENQKQLTLLEGQAPKQAPVVHDDDFCIEGGINTPILFDEQFTSEDERSKVCGRRYLHLNRQEKTATLHCYYDRSINREVRGKLFVNPEIKELGINEDKKYTLSDLARRLKAIRFWFADTDQHADLISQLKNFTADVRQKLEKADDGRGNVKKHFSQAVDTDVPFEFKLKMPIYRGESERTFNVEILMDVRDGGVTCFLESAELRMLLERNCETAFQVLRNYFKEAKCPIIEL